MKTLKPINQKSVFYSYDPVILKLTNKEISVQKARTAGRALGAMSKTKMVIAEGYKLDTDFNLKDTYLAFGELFQKIMNDEIKIEAAKAIQELLEEKVKSFIAEVVEVKARKSLISGQKKSEINSIGMKDIEEDSENVTYKE
jgi:hypothetical protein